MHIILITGHLRYQKALTLRLKTIGMEKSAAPSIRTHQKAISEGLFDA